MVSQSRAVCNSFSKQIKQSEKKSQVFSLKPIARIVGVCAVGVGFGLANSAAQAATIFVDSSGDAQAIDGSCTLREAVIALRTVTSTADCSASGGFGTDDTILFSGSMAAGGTIVLENNGINISSDITIDASDTVAGVTIDANYDSRIFDLKTNTSFTIDKLTIINGSVTNTGGIGGEESGGAIDAEIGSELIVLNSTISNNKAFNGAGISSLGTVTLDDSMILDNTATDSGGGVFVESDDELTITGSTISGNSSLEDEGGGIFAESIDTMTITGSTISGNFALNDCGGGIFAESIDTMTITGSTISGNSSYDRGGGIFAESIVTMTTTGSTISGNFALNDGGGGIFAESIDTMTITGSTISGNTSYEEGGGIYAQSIDIMTITGSTISGNSNLYDEGGGIYAESIDTMTITGSTISGNSSLDGDGGGIYVDNVGTVSITGSVISDNTASYGGGITIGGETTGTVSASSISNNTANDNSSGGGVAVGGESTLNIVESTVSGNSSGRGGGIYVADSTVVVLKSTISGNTAYPDGDFGGEGGGIATYGDSRLYAIESTVSGNSARVGGGIYGYEYDFLNIFNSTISNNASTDVDVNTGSGIHTNGSTLTIFNSIVANSLSNADCYFQGGENNVSDFSIIEDGTCGALRSGDPGLEALSNNGGPTKTHLPKENSIAINTGDIDACSLPFLALEGDQRSEPRPDSSGACDVGSVEFQESDIVSFYVIPLPNGGSAVIAL